MDSDTARDRETYKFYQAAINSLELRLWEDSPGCSFPPRGYVPRACKDTALTALAQLGAVRLNVNRGLISLLDEKYQYVLAEATRSLTLLPNMELEPQADLWLGSITIPRKEGVCEHVLSLEAMVSEPANASSNGQALVINDLRKDSRFEDREFVRGEPGVRFYAGVPLRSPWGTTIGAYCVFGNEPRDGLTQDELLALQGLATTVMKYLEACKAKESHRRYEQMLHGLASFVTGEPSMHPYVHQRLPPSGDSSQQDSTQSGTMTEDLAETQSGGDQKPKNKKRLRLPSTSTPRARKKSSTSLQESMLPSGSKKMFSRAANIMRESIDVCGCIIFDASVATFGGAINVLHRRKSVESQPENVNNSSSDTSSSHLSGSDQPSPPGEPWSMGGPFPGSGGGRAKGKKMCDVLGFSYRNSASISGNEPGMCCAELAESDLKRLLRRYPSGHILNVSSSTDMVSSQGPDSLPNMALRPEVFDGDATHLHASMSSTGKNSIMVQKLLKVAPGARSIAILPLWDYQRDRWFAGCLCWTTKPNRNLYPDVDLIYLQAFGNSIMVELSRLDAITSDRAKTAFVASISHELRCPLHGILGGVQLLQSTKIDAYQTSMLDSVSICGRTLLDTVDHVLDFAKVNTFSKLPLAKQKDGRIKLVGGVGGQHPNEPASLSADIDLATLVEEVVETVFVGQAHRGALSRLEQMVDQNMVQQRLDDVSRNNANRAVSVVLDISHHSNWIVTTQPGAWRRIAMNLFGNALKYTVSGYVRVSMRLDSKRDSKNGDVCLIVSDTGKGISKEYQNGGLWRPFSQEDSFAPGTGLGLSIVHQIIQGLGGNIDLKSEVGGGTEVKVNFTLPIAENLSSPDEEDRYLYLATSRLRGHKVCILETTNSGNLPTMVEKGRRELGLALSRTLREWFGADAMVSDVVTAFSAEVIVCLEPRMDLLAALKAVASPEKTKLVVFVARNTREATRIKDDAGIRGRESAVEIVTQPCGPRKLAKSLNQALVRREQVLSQMFTPQPSPPTASGTPEAASPAREWTTPKWMPTHVANPPPIARARSASTIDLNTIPQSLLDKNMNTRSTQPPPADNRLRILLVDDNRINLTLLTAFMRKHRYDYEEATNGLEAVETFKHATSPFDYVLMDLTMPIMDGMAATREIRRYEQRKGIEQTTIIALTGLASASARVEALNSGINYFLTKPVRFQSLHQMLKGELAEGGGP